MYRRTQRLALRFRRIALQFGASSLQIGHRTFGLPDEAVTKAPRKVP